MECEHIELHYSGDKPLPRELIVFSCPMMLILGHKLRFKILFTFFQQACGFEYTSKLQRMFQDIGVSKTLIVEYDKYCQSHNITDTGKLMFIFIKIKNNNFTFSLFFRYGFEFKFMAFLCCTQFYFTY